MSASSRRIKREQSGSPEVPLHLSQKIKTKGTVSSDPLITSLPSNISKCSSVLSIYSILPPLFISSPSPILSDGHLSNETQETIDVIEKKEMTKEKDMNEENGGSKKRKEKATDECLGSSSVPLSRSATRYSLRNQGTLLYKKML